MCFLIVRYTLLVAVYLLNGCLSGGKEFTFSHSSYPTIMYLYSSISIKAILPRCYSNTQHFFHKVLPCVCWLELLLQHHPIQCGGCISRNVQQWLTSHWPQLHTSLCSFSLDSILRIALPKYPFTHEQGILYTTMAYTSSCSGSFNLASLECSVLPVLNATCTS